MNRILISLAFALVPLLASASQHADGDYVVALVGNMSPDTVLRQHGLGASKKWTRAVHGFAAHLNGNQADRLEQDTRVQFIEPDVTVHELAQTLPTGVRRIGCTNNARWLASSTTPIDVDVAVIDTGIDLTHPDLNVFANTTFVTGTTTGNDDRGHGTHCAGIIGARNNTIGVVGVAPGCRLWSVKVLDSNGNGDLSTIISGVDYVAQHSSEIEVANMSFGGQGSSGSLRLAIQNAVALGVVFVAAAGNSEFEIYGGDNILGTSDDFFPASYPEVMTVAAIGDEDGLLGGAGNAMTYGLDDSLAGYSNYSIAVDASNPVYSAGLAIDVCAPGTSIYSTYMGGTYATMSGTSMAAPHVAGAVALYIAANARATTAAGVYAIRQAIIDRATDSSHWGVWADRVNPVRFTIPNAPLIDVSDGPKPSNYPTITMTSPLLYGTATWYDNLAETCIATATDATDGDITAKIVWKAQRVGSMGTPIWTKDLGTGGTISALVTNLYLHFITASVTNSAGRFTQANAKVVVHAAPVSGTAPNLAITAPATGSTYATTDLITFTATCTDAIDGNIASRVVWTSSIDGGIGTGSTIQSYLGAGSQIITASSTNSIGLSTNKTITLTITGVPPAANHNPIVTITSPSAGASYPVGTTIPIHGTASDQEDGDLSANIQWNSGSGLFAIGPDASTNGLPVGANTITATVWDSSGAMASLSRQVTVTSAGTPLTVTVSANKAAYVNKEKALITTTVRQAGVAVSGATVTVHVNTATKSVSTKTGTTTSAGTFAFYLPIQKNKYGTGSGPFTATVSASASKTGFVSGSGSTTFKVY